MHDLNKEKVSRRETLRIAMLGSLATVVGASNVLEGSLVGTAAAATGSTSFAPPPGGAAGNRTVGMATKKFWPTSRRRHFLLATFPLPSTVRWQMENRMQPELSPKP